MLPLADGGTALYPADEDVAAIVSAAAEVAQEKGGVTVGTISADILRGGDNGSDRGIESPMGNLIADVMLWATTPVAAPEARAASAVAAPVADIAFMNPGGLRADLLYGTDGSVTYRDVANVQPFANTITTVTLTGAQIKSVLEEQWQPEGASRPKLHL